MKNHVALSLVAIQAICVLCTAAPSFAQDHARPIDAARLFRGTWLEVARRPMWITDGCNQGTTGYLRSAQPNQVRVRDACRKGNEETVLSGDAEILDPGVNSRLRVRYNPLLSVEYNIVDHAPDYSWFIEASPTLENVFIFTRKRPSSKQLSALVERAQLLGYNTSGLEFPWGR
jgi:apolipoprotein D and lipocalin family protein